MMSAVGTGVVGTELGKCVGAGVSGVGEPVGVLVACRVGESDGTSVGDCEVGSCVGEYVKHVEDDTLMTL